MNRRTFLRAALATASVATSSHAAENPAAEVTPSKLPRWRGFNLLEKFVAETKQPFVERDFAWIKEWGFDFVRLPLDYRCWARQDDWLTIDDAELKQIDDAVALGEKYGVHVNVAFHRAPGYSVNKAAPETLSLWHDEPAQAAFAHHWRAFAKRYAGVPNARVSFNLVNEPDLIAEDKCVRPLLRAIEAIREEDATRLIIADGRQWARVPIPSLANHDVAQSTRGYEPMRISHYKASWINGADKWPVPTWPFPAESGEWNKDRLRKFHVDPWKKIEAQGVGVHVGEFGAFNQTPHAVTLAWMRDFLDLWKEAGWGWAMWNLRGSMGIVDSERADVTYEDFQGHKLDRAMLQLLQTN
ncbi:MAG: cellulase family glycosylhydrolase [Candidatus Hydrogenedentes bacterium]|nr:cellulase family glycosylhydrolase [Candidatus Hydrogenedentota bacterium]